MWDVIRWALIWSTAGTVLTVASVLVGAAVKTVAAPPAPENGQASNSPAKRSILSSARSTPGNALPVSASWSFKDSWAANLTGLVTAFAAVVAAFKDPLDSIVPGLELARFSVVSAFALGVTTLAPMLYATFTSAKADEQKQLLATGTIGGLLAASAATTAGLFAAIGGIAWISVGRYGNTPVESGLGWALLAVSLLVVLYAYNTLIRLLTWSASEESDTGLVVGIVSTTCCGETATRRTVSLL